MPTAPKDSPYYQIESVGRACRLLRVLQEHREGLPLFQLAKIASLSRPSAFRLLATLQANGFVAKDSGNTYRLASEHLPGRKYRIGYVTETSDSSFYQAVTRGLQEASTRAGIDLVIYDSRDNPDVALQNAERMLKENLDLIIEFQSYANVGTLISSRAGTKQLPVIAVEMPYPNTIYFGVDNCQAGLMAGRHLARWAEQHWSGQIDEILLIGSSNAGALPEARLTASLLGIHEISPRSSNSKVIRVDGNWRQDVTYDAVMRYLKKSTSKKILVSAINDPCSIGALAAFRDAARLPHCAIVAQNGTMEVRMELRRQTSRLIAAVGYFPENYGKQLVGLAIDVISRSNPVPNAVFIKHQLLTRKNVSDHYPHRKDKGD